MPSTTLAEPETLPAEVDGARHPLLFVHGAWHGAWCWHDHFIPRFPARGWECHAVDLRHHGGRGGPGSLRRTRIRHYVDDLHEAVDALDRPPILVAHSMGGLVAQRLLERRALPGAVLLAPVPVGGVWRAAARVMRRHPLRFLWATAVLDLGPVVAGPRMAKAMLLDPDSDEPTVTAVADRLQGESYLAFLDMLVITRARPPLVRAPVALVTGDRDRIFSAKEIRRTAGAYGVEPTVIPGAAHDLMLGPRWEQAAEATLQAIERF